MAQIAVEVAYAKPEQQCILKVLVEPGTTILEVIKASGILEQFPEIDLERQAVGIFSELRPLSDLVLEGERVEIYRPLLVDPKEERRRKAGRK